MKELTVKSVISTDKKKTGEPLVGKFGPYWLIRIDTVEEGYISMFAKESSNLKAGDKITGIVTETESNGYKNKNFAFPKAEDISNERIDKLEKRILTLEQRLGTAVAEIKSNVVLDMTGKFQTDSDFAQSNKSLLDRHPDMPDFDENNIPF